MDAAMKLETLADALGACELVERGTVLDDPEMMARAAGLLRRVLRRQGMLLAMAHFLVRQNPRDERKLQELAKECGDEEQALTVAQCRQMVAAMPEVPVPRPTPNPVDPPVSWTGDKEG